MTSEITTNKAIVVIRRLHFAGAVHSRHPFPADPIFSERGSDGMILVQHDVIGDRMINFAASAL